MTGPGPEGAEPETGPPGVAPAVLAQFARLGLALSPDADPRPGLSWAREDGSAWSADGPDPEGTFDGRLPAPLYALLTAAWPDDLWLVDEWDPENRRAFEPGAGSEGFDARIDGRRVLLTMFGWRPRAQFLCCLDALDPDPDPVVHEIDHDGSDLSLGGEPLSEFLARLEVGPAPDPDPHDG